MTDLAAIANQLRSIADQIDPPAPPVTRHRHALPRLHLRGDVTPADPATIRAIRARKDQP